MAISISASKMNVPTTISCLKSRDCKIRNKQLGKEKWENQVHRRECVNK